MVYLIVDTMDDNELLYSEHYSCPVVASQCRVEPRLFSFNAPLALVRPVTVLGNKLGSCAMDLVILMLVNTCVKALTSALDLYHQLLSSYATGRKAVRREYGYTI